MKIKLLKNHVLGKQGDIIKANFFRGKYLISEGVAIEHKQTKVNDDVDKVEEPIKTTEKIVDNGSNTKKRATKKRKTNVKP